MPPQQPDRLLDLVDQLLDFRAHLSSARSAAGDFRPAAHDVAIRLRRRNRVPLWQMVDSWR
jgi:hypothetical protein